ncbi:acetyltransferase [Photobacterium damselae]|uniref:acetyltransferase n=1 Tax=Photobacterium damselae TaxID=38293 RepID=UPI0025433478
MCGGLTRNKKVESYGVTAIDRPKIKATKHLDLSGVYGQQIVKSESKLALRTHRKTFEKLADM